MEGGCAVRAAPKAAVGINPGYLRPVPRLEPQDMNIAGSVRRTAQED
jgi:hypothetical protein